MPSSSVQGGKSILPERNRFRPCRDSGPFTKNRLCLSSPLTTDRRQNRTTWILGVPTTSVAGSNAVMSDLPLNGVHDGVPDRLGRDLSGESSRWRVASNWGPTHKLPWDKGSIFVFQHLVLFDTGEACIGLNQQLQHGGLHQQAGWSSVCCPAEDGGEPCQGVVCYQMSGGFATLWWGRSRLWLGKEKWICLPAGSTLTARDGFLRHHKMIPQTWACVDKFANVPWPRKLLYAFMPLHVIFPRLESEPGAAVSHLVASGLCPALWYAEMTQMVEA